MTNTAQAPGRSNIYQTISQQSRMSAQETGRSNSTPARPGTRDDMSLGASTAMEKIHSKIQDVKGVVAGLKTSMQNIQMCLEQMLKPKITVKTTVSAEPSGLTNLTGDTYGSDGMY
jgi:hypothetical protein